MSNTLKFIDMVAREALSVAHETAQFIGTVDRQYDDTYAKSGAKIGSVLRVRSPNKYTVREGSRVMDVQDQNESTQTITMATQSGVDMRFNSAELTLDTDSPADVAAFSKRYIDPAVKVLVSTIESNFLAASTKATYNLAGAVAAITNLATPGLARAKINQNLGPKGDRSIQMDSVSMAGLVNGVAAYFNPSGAISAQYKEGLVARTSMADYYENERVWSMTMDDDVTANTNANALVTNGGSSVAVSEDLAQADQVVGTVFTIAGVFACHPETKARYPHLQQFVITATGATSVSVSPTIYLTGANKNVVAASGANLAVADFNEKAMTFVGVASATYLQPLMYHKEAFQFVTADLPLMDDAHKCARRTQDGLSMRVWMASDIRNDELLMRLDILHGYAALRPEWACRMMTAAS